MGLQRKITTKERTKTLLVGGLAIACIARRGEEAIGNVKESNHSTTCGKNGAEIALRQKSTLNPGLIVNRGLHRNSLFECWTVLSYFF